MVTIVNSEGTDTGNEGEDKQTDIDPDAETGDAGEGESKTALASSDDEGELVVAIGKEPDASADDDAEIMAPDDTGSPPSTTLQNLRKKAREDARKLRQLEDERDAALAAVSAKQPAAPDAVVVGDKPTLESSDYDAEKFEADLTAWHERKRKAEEQQNARDAARKADETAYGQRLDVYRQGSAQLKVANFKAAETAVVSVLSPAQQSIIVRHAKNAALVVFALGNDSVKLKELAAISDPIEFAIKARDLESEIKTVKRPFKPEGKAPSGNGSGAPAVGGDALERARQQAAKTGDYTEVNRLRRAQRDAERAKQ